MPRTVRMKPRKNKSKVISEFSNPRALEFDLQGNKRLNVFYCNPSAPYQKGACENNHEMIRRIIPKGVDFTYSKF